MVKELAKETAIATEEISKQIDMIQTDTKRAVDAIASISETIGQINQIQTAIAGAVEEQTATTAEIARSVSEANTATLGIAENISGVAQAADEQTAGVNKNFSAARGLAEMAAEVRRYVDEFKVSDDRPSGDQAGGESTPLSRVAAAAVDPMVVSPTPASRAAAA